MVILIDTEKAFYKIHHSFYMKTFQEMRNRKEFTTWMKGVFENRISNFTQWSTECFFPITGNKAKISTFTNSVQHCKFYSLY